MQPYHRVGWTRIAIGAAALIAIFVGGRAGAQTAAQQARYSVIGTVADHDGHTIPLADIQVIERDSVTRRVRADNDGKFTISALPSPSITLRVRKIGYATKDVVVSAGTMDAVARVVVSLEQSVDKLDPVKVEEAAPDTLDARLAAFKSRAATNSFGHYIDWTMLDKLHPQWPSEALRTVPGIVLRPSRRIGNITRLRNCGVAGESNDRVGPLVWVDGVRLPGGELDESVQASDIAAIEVYSSFAGIPSQFFDRTAVCGTIVVWTKSR